MNNIEIDFEVFKALTNLRDNEAVTYNDVIRKLLDLGPISKKNPEEQSIQKNGWTYQNIVFPDGTCLRAKYKGVYHYGEIKNGQFIVNGDIATSLSDAARLITHNSVNGWKFWEYKIPNELSWKSVENLRKRHYS